MTYIWVIVAVLWFLEALRLRARASQLPLIPSVPDRSSDENYQLILPSGSIASRSIETDAAAWARVNNADYVELIPRNIRTLEAVAVLNARAPQDYAEQSNQGHFAGAAILVSQALLDRAQVNAVNSPEPLELARMALILKRFAFRNASIAVAPNLSVPTRTCFFHWPVFRDSQRGTARAAFLAKSIGLLILVVGMILAPKAGLAALVLFHLQLVIAFIGTPLQPRDLLRTTLFRTPFEFWDWFTTFFTRIRDHASEPDAELHRRYYQEALAKGLDRFFEAPRTDCPLCGARQLSKWLHSREMIQGKPGRFTLDRCLSCGHVFQNPKLSTEGLNFYYRDFYGGLGRKNVEMLLGSTQATYKSRAQSIAEITTPRNWLDVGGGHGHFCAAARKTWPQTRFDGLDICEEIEEAVRAGWLDRAFRGFFPDVAPTVAGQYDVVSLFHCLEHTPDPWADIRAAREALEPGGILIIEVPDPEFPVGRWVGQFWFPWFQPQHLHLFSAGNLQKLLKTMGFDPIKLQRKESYTHFDLEFSLVLFLLQLAPILNQPWRPRPKGWHRFRNAVVWVAGTPLILLARLLDLVLGPILANLGYSNAYRIVARRSATDEVPPGSPSLASVPVQVN